VNLDVTGSSYIIQNLAPILLLDGSVTSPSIPDTEISMVGFVGAMVCNTPSKTIGSINALLVGASDVGSTEQLTINKAHGV